MDSTSKIALLRGINVGGKNRMKMAELRSCLSNAGHENVRTHIQSGNIALDSKLSCSKLESLIHDSIKEAFGYDVPVLVREQQYFQKVVAKSPYCDAGDPKFDVAQLHVSLLGKKPAAKAVRELAGLEFTDHYKIVGDVVYLRLFGAYHKTKLNNNFLEKKLGVTATSRNWKTIRKLVEM